MTRDLHHLVYYSRNRIAADGATLCEAVRRILAASQENNRKAGLTGALMFNSGCFAQVLEGPLDAVEETFERISRDERHGEVSVLAFEPVALRSFGTWSMAFVGGSLEDAERFADVARSSGFEPARLSGDRLHEILRDLAIEAEPATARTPSAVA
ncbi:BLUF domain-containing protein [Aurantimonas sp. VKM B-3413]|uniref:BLUF domain-containing protein n=1 Tax=Aurantimonas sp. VKM B-3413 TaxID=2779401 RepID=UPI001E2DD2D4|nr:BLUF domain-containing protein [Aurantimonas sp. VKM B-3413]MCB8838809.1 BLUF domain-containing protein [Aurantimonas sp. VKM B-3413]